MFIDKETDEFLIDEIFSKEHFCRNCSHITYQKDNHCMWCGSDQIGLYQPTSAKKLKACRENSPGRNQEEQPSVIRMIQYPYHYRLTRGFAIMNGGSV